MANEWIDVSVPLRTDMVHWPTDPAVTIARVRAIAAGASADVSHLDMGAHTGTHMDAPVHFVPGAPGIDALPLDAVIGQARVIAIADPVSIMAAELRPLDLLPGERLLFKTLNSERCWQSDSFVEDFVYVSAEAAGFLVERGVRTVGVDYLSVGGYFRDGPETHETLLRAGVWIIEGLNLGAVQPGVYDLICLPLRIAGCDGAPARAVLRATT